MTEKKKLATRNIASWSLALWRKFHTRWQKLDKSILLVFFLSTLAAWPFWTYRGLPEATDAELHIFRIAELGFSLKAGNLYPRWAPNFYSGYGYPIFNFYAPLTYHLGNWVTLLHPEKAVLGAKILFIAAHYLGATGAYFLGREFSNRSGGVLSSATFAFSPYIMVINPHIRGDLAEVFALALLPWALWFWECLWQGRGRRYFVGAVTSGCVVLLSHNLTGLSLMVLLLLMSLWQWLVQRRTSQFLGALLAGVLIVALTAYFWLPFVIERGYVQLENVVDKDHYDFNQHFVSLRQLLALLPAQDWRATTNIIPMSVGLPGFILTILGAFIAAKKNLTRYFFYISITALCFWLITRSSLIVWENVPGFDFFQFPWRFLGFWAALSIPLVAQVGTISLPQPSYPYVITAILMGIVIAAIPGWYVLPWESPFNEITPANYIAFESQGRWRGTTSTNDFVPQTVQMLPAPQPELLQSYTLGEVDRVNRYTVPNDANVSIIPDVPWRHRFVVDTLGKFVLRLYLFYFPGWQAYIDEQPVPIEIADPEGFITVEVPAGHHEVKIQFEDTWSRKLGWGIAVTGLVISAVVLYFYRASEASPPDSQSLSNTTFLNVATVSLLALVGAKLTFLDALPCFHYMSPNGAAHSAQYEQKADFSGEIALLGYDIVPDQVKAGTYVDVILYLQAQHPLTETYQSFVHIVYPEEQIWTQSDNLNPGNFPTNLWPTDHYIRDHHLLELPEAMPSGDYQILIGLYTLHDAQRLTVVSADCGAGDDNVVLCQPIHVGD